jgi:hypothetical protein
MRPRPALLVLSALGLALPATASADVYIDVPVGFLGGPIATPLPAVDANGQLVVGPGRPSGSPGVASQPCRGASPDDCIVWGGGANLEPVPLPAPGPAGPGAEGDGPGVETDPPPDTDTPGAAIQEVAAPAVAPTAQELQAAFGGLLRPEAADWLPWQRTTLAWRRADGARFYNVQVFRGSRRVLNAVSADTRLPVPLGVLRQGRTYVWVVWPGSGPRRSPAYGTPIGRSTFEITLRPRIVFRARGGSRRTVLAEVRPHIPFGTLRLSAPRALARRVPPRVTIGRDGRFVLPISRRAAERLGAVLTDRGSMPPVGLRGPGRR